MKKQRSCLTLEVRQQIWMMRSSGAGIREIGRKLELDGSIVCRELKRNGLPRQVSKRLTALEQASEAHEKARRRRQEKRRGKRKALPVVQKYEHIAEKLVAKWSPEAIANTWGKKFPGESISTSTIYRMIKHDWPELMKHLPERGKMRRQRVMNRRGKVQQAAADKRHISERPDSANQRKELGIVLELTSRCLPMPMLYQSR